MANIRHSSVANLRIAEDNGEMTVVLCAQTYNSMNSRIPRDWICTWLVACVAT